MNDIAPPDTHIPGRSSRCSMDLQTSLFPQTVMPPGFRYRPEIITPEEEADLAREIAALDLRPFEFRGYRGLRRVRSFGYRYDYDRRAVDAADPIPPFLLGLREKAAA